MHIKNSKLQVIEEKIPEVQRELDFTKKLLTDKMTSVNDLLIMLNLHTSYCLMMTRRLISAERDLNIAVSIFNKTTVINQDDRPDIPVIPISILKQRILLQRAQIMKGYNKTKEAALLLTSILKMGKVYDPMTRKEALKTLQQIFINYPKGNLMEMFPETKNIDLMLQLFENNKHKNVVLCVDALKDEVFEQKKMICSKIFDSLTPEDKASLISISRKVNVVFSLSNKSKNTTQLSNQLKYLEPATGKRLFLLKGLKEAVKQCMHHTSKHSEHYYKWIV